MSQISFYGVQDRSLTAADKVRMDIEERRNGLRRHREHDASLEQRLGQSLDSIDDAELRRLFDDAFGSLATFEWSLRCRRGRIVSAQRSALLRALACGMEATR